MEISGCWILYCNPAYFDIEEFLSLGETFSTWTIVDWQAKYFEPGQQGIVRVGNDNRSISDRNGKEKLKSGIYAIFEVTSHADYIPDSDGKLWFNPEKRDKARMRIKIKITQNLLYSPISIETLKNLDETKDNTALIQGRQASSWPIAEKAFKKIVALSEIESQKIDILNEEFVQTIEDITKLEEKYRNATPTVKEVISRRIERGEIANEIKKINHYKCQVCEALDINPHSFIKRNGKPYIETHHIIPVSELKTGILGLSNLMTICANHHRQMHFGNVKIISENDRNFMFNIDGQTVVINKCQLTVSNHEIKS